MNPSRGKRRGLLALCLFGTLLFTSLGIWQMQRLAWKRDLIARVETRVHAPPRALPARPHWPTMDLHDMEYRRVKVQGTFLHDRETLVDAVTALGPGAWVITPLRTADGIVLVNRGFVPPGLETPASRAAGQVAGEVEVIGLLRRSEPEGRILRSNRPAADRWFSRDVAAIAAARDLADVAPFFIDAEPGPETASSPQGGLTVVRFRNAHLTYAVTWIALAALCIAGVVLLRTRSPERQVSRTEDGAV